MAETSYFWDGYTVGDAALAPYDATAEFSEILGLLFSSDGDGYVVPAYLNNLNVQASAPAAATIDVATGAAFVRGFTYKNSVLNTLAIAANASGNPRLDRIVLRVDWANQQARVAVLQGTAAASPSLPALTQTFGTTWEVPLAYIWVANGFATITDVDIHDERVFINTALARKRASGRTNLVKNSEFIVLETSAISAPSLQCGVWATESVNGPVGYAAVAKPSQQTRGNAFRITCNAAFANTLFQLIPCRPSTTYIIRTLIQTAAAGAEIEVQGSTGFTTLLKRTVRFVAAWTEEQLVVTTGAADTYMKFIYRGVANQTLTMGQTVIVEGYIPGEFEPVHEFIPTLTHEVGAAWNFTAKSTGITAVDLTAVWGNLAAFAQQDIRAVQLLLGGNDSASAAAATGACEMSIWVPTSGAGKSLYLNLAGYANDRRLYITGIVPVWAATSPTAFVLGFDIKVTATGAGTFDAFVAITGVYT